MSTQTDPPPGSNTASAAETKPWALKSLPPFPAVALQLLSLLEDDEVPMNKVSDLLRMDPALSAEILRVANSVLYGLSRRIDNVSHATVVLGTEAVKRLALTVALGRFSHRFLHNESLRVCWDHSVACGLIAEELAVMMDQPRSRAYTAGLLHDVGRLALLACYPVEYGNLFDVAREHGFDELECERQLFDVDHCEAGEWLARSWNLPAEFVESIAGHHKAPAKDASLVSLVAASSAIADTLGYNVMQITSEKTIAEIIADLPIPDKEAAAKKLEDSRDRIQAVVGQVSAAK
jgi:HD-like signal output (HDOD) protein